VRGDCERYSRVEGKGREEVTFVQDPVDVFQSSKHLESQRCRSQSQDFFTAFRPRVGVSGERKEDICDMDRSRIIRRHEYSQYLAPQRQLVGELLCHVPEEIRSFLFGLGFGFFFGGFERFELCEGGFDVSVDELVHVCYGVEPFAVVVQEEEFAHLEPHADATHHFDHCPSDVCFFGAGK
jgi:hypothetical protein